MVSQELTKLHQMICGIEDEGIPVSQGEVIFGLLRAFDTDSITHMLQLVRDAQNVKEGVVRAQEKLEEAQYNLNAIADFFRFANE